MLSSGVKQVVRYWGFLCAKFLAAGAILAGLLLGFNSVWPSPKIPDVNYLVYLLGNGVALLAGLAVFYLAILDQRYRCRVCLRRLRMPVGAGSWSNMLLFGRPRTEYICTYGHGTLNISELRISGIENPEWTEHADYWAELCETGKDSDPFPR